MSTSATITITDITQPAQNLFTLLSKGSMPGYTVVPNGGIITPMTLIGGVSYLSVQASLSNSAIVYKGDEKTANDGSRQGKEMPAGSADVIQGLPTSVNLQEIYLRASANGAKINVEIHYC
jgi:hypothetical protein